MGFLNLIFFFLFFFGVYFCYLFFILNEPINVLLSLIMVFTNISAILLVLGAEFISIIFLIVYVGAIAMLVLFSIMMLNLKKKKKKFKIINFSYLISIFFLFFMNFFFIIKISYYKWFIILLENNNILSFHILEFTSYIYDIFFKVNQMKSIGVLFYLNYYPLFILGGLILLLGMAGPIILLINEK